MGWLHFGVGVATFLAAAKAHGRQLRLERELAGVWQVDFRAVQPEVVAAIWNRERRIYWSIAAGTALLAAAVRFAGPRLGWAWPEGARGFAGGLVAHVGVPMTIAFVITGALSVLRLLDARGSAPSAEWLDAAAWGSVGWWAVALALCVALGATLAARRA
jgi:hypothetical protein